VRQPLLQHRCDCNRNTSRSLCYRQLKELLFQTKKPDTTFIYRQSEPVWHVGSAVRWTDPSLNKKVYGMFEHGGAPPEL
jgi:hypothetical protein